MFIKVQTEDFSVQSVIDSLKSGRKDVGAITTFIGYVRDLTDNKLISLTLEHYPGMTEKSLEDIAQQALKRWDLQDISIIHRVGELRPTEQIVLVAAVSAHRGESFQACEFIMDYLKTSAPFWKKEKTIHSDSWVDAKESDDLAKERWS